MERVKPVWEGENASEKSRLHPLLSFSLQEGQGQNRLMESCGERAQPLQSVKFKYLAVYPVGMACRMLGLPHGMACRAAWPGLPHGLACRMAWPAAWHGPLLNATSVAE